MKTLKNFAYARSGDKGSNSNIGVIAYTESDYLFLKEWLTSDIVRDFLYGWPIQKVTRYELPNLWALNFVLTGALGEGGSRSLYLDAQGKTLAQRMLQMEIEEGKGGFIHAKTQSRKEG